MLLIFDTCNVSLVPPVNSGGQVSALSQSEESRAPARRGGVEGAQAASGHEAFVLFVVLMKRRRCHSLKESLQCGRGLDKDDKSTCAHHV